MANPPPPYGNNNNTLNNYPSSDEDNIGFTLDDEDENIDLGIPPVSPTATVPVTFSPSMNPASSAAQNGNANLKPGAYSPATLTPGKNAATPRSPATIEVSGNLGTGFGNTQTAGTSRGNTSFTQGVTDTLDEPVSATILRDLKNVWRKLKQVLVPHGKKDILKDWDLWGPLLLCLTLAIVLSLITDGSQSATVFTNIFVIVWVGSAVVTVNSKLLGGRVSFFQSVCVLGYCIFPLCVAAIVSFFCRIALVRFIMSIVGFVWSTYASVGFLSDRQLDNRRSLAVYPIFLFYFAIGWIVYIA